MPASQIFSTIVYVLRTGCQWERAAQGIRQHRAAHKHFQDWHKAGFFLRLWQAGLDEYDGMQGIAWGWQSIDGAMGKAPLAQECVGLRNHANDRTPQNLRKLSVMDFAGDGPFS